jgi:allene oxide cyclase
MHRLALAAVIGAIALAAVPAAQAAQRAVTLAVTGQQAGVTRLDLGATGDSAGDLTTFNGRLTSAAGAGTVVGTAIVMQTGARSRPASGTITYQLADGQIVVGGLAEQAAGGIRRGVAFTRPVLGGSGPYLGAHGSVTQIQAADGSFASRFSLKIPAATPVTPVVVGGPATGSARIDLGTSGPSAGDLTVIAATLDDPAGSPIGRLRGVQTTITTDGVANVVQGELTYVLADGEVVVGGVSQQVAAGTGLVPGTAFARPILGGTGRYAGAGGTATSTTSGGVYSARLDLIGVSTPPRVAQTVRFISRVPTIETIDLGAPGKTPGDIYVVNAALASANGRTTIGALRGTQTSIVTEVGAETVQASLTFQLRHGQVVVGGLSQYPLDATGTITGRTYVRSVLGGTGRYEGAHGTLTSTRRADGSYDQVLRFVR